MPGRIVDEILNALRKHVSNLNGITIEKVVRGSGYTCVKLSSGHVGVCFSFSNEVSPSSDIMSGNVSKMAGRNAMELANLARSWNLGESAMGIATINALSAIALPKIKELSVTVGNILDDIAFEKEDTVVFVGRISPLIKRVGRKVKRIYVLEKDPARRKIGMLPGEAAQEILPKAHVAIITGTSIANGTIDRLLELCCGSREIAVVGASASVLPMPLFENGVTIIGGMRVLNPDRLLHIVAEGGGTEQLKEAAQFINVRPKRVRF